MSLEITLQFPDPLKGGLYIADTAAHTGNFRGILSLEDAVVDLTGGSLKGTITAVPIPKGVYLPVLTPYVKFASGKGIACNL